MLVLIRIGSSDQTDKKEYQLQRSGTRGKAKREALALRKRIGSKSKELKKATTKGVLPRINRDLKL